MAREIPLSQIGNYIEGQYEKLLRAAVFETDRRVKEASPIDTGRLRVSWQIGQNSASGGIKPEGQYSTAITPPDRINYSQEKLGNVYSIHNNLPYVEPVLTGKNLPPSWNGTWRSKGNQIEKGYIPYVIQKDMKDFIKVNAARIGRES
ncbi:tail completion or Neck1 protein [Cyanophage KBS-S-2A]|jgi:hypothetical protein|uniref:tail completion or Neck1 protein n=1 Tax=Cyanophage KBS-S-2A TaxID=889953 RepID=UPI0002C18A7A|nr:tail completion or Neck1 protein [Cyanophage KBS-S-2A]AGH57686.1 hypothetical protein CPKG_00055 [Cyanophage KBS-S-2A]